MDRSLGVDPIRSTLVSLGARIEIHDDHFDKAEEDRVWLREVGARDWVVLAKDKRLRYRPLERDALFKSGARVFILVSGNLRGSQIAEAFAAALRRVYRVLEKHPGPFVAGISRNGEVRLISPS